MPAFNKDSNFGSTSLKIKHLKNYEQLYKTYFDELCIYALKFTPDRDLIKDVVQDTFVDLWVNRKQLSIRSSLKSYLYRIVYNKLMDAFKKNSKKRIIHTLYYESNLADLAQKIENDEDYRTELVKKLNYCMSNLPKRCKEVFMAVKINGEKYKNVALKLDLSIKTIEGHISRAFKLIKECTETYK